ncbi:MAG: tripartite tricarboxylate transporter substrate binding protein [Usitatibacter sp.]
MKFAGIAAAALAFAVTAATAAWPEKPIKVLVGYAPGGSTDVVARLLAPKLGEKLGQPIVIENKPGGAGDFAGELMLQAPADGYTLLMTTVALHAINPGLLKQRFHPLDDFTPIAMVCSYPMIMIGSPQTTFKTPAELQDLAAKAPTFYASSGVGSPGHLSGELLVRALGGANITHVPYKGGAPSVLAIMSGEAQVNFATLPAVVPQIRGGKVRPIGLASRSRNPAVPDVPTLTELGLADFEVGTWSGLVGPKGVPADVIRKINEAVRDVVNDPAIQKRLVDEGAEIKLMSPQEFGRFMRAENLRWVKVVKDAGITPQ